MMTEFLSLYLRIFIFFTGVLIFTSVHGEEVLLSHETLWRSIFQRPPLKEQTVSFKSNKKGTVEEAKRSLGELLFSDPRLSGNKQRSCSSCHRKEQSFTDGHVRALGLKGEPLLRNTPHLWNLGDVHVFFWDGREKSLQSQARIPLHSPQELAVNMVRTLQEFTNDAVVAEGFARAFPEESQISEDLIVEALASYEKSLISPHTRFDAWVEGDDNALTEDEKKGLKIFVGKGGCVSCHGGWRFTDDQFHDIGLKSEDLGHGARELGNLGIPSFKTPGLRQVSQTAPYMHDGSLPGLEDVILHYTFKRTLRPSLSPNFIGNLELNEEERANLVSFLRTL